MTNNESIKEQFNIVNQYAPIYNYKKIDISLSGISNYFSAFWKLVFNLKTSFDSNNNGLLYLHKISAITFFLYSVLIYSIVFLLTGLFSGFYTHPFISLGYCLIGELFFLMPMYGIAVMIAWLIVSKLMGIDFVKTALHFFSIYLFYASIRQMFELPIATFFVSKVGIENIIKYYLTHNEQTIGESINSLIRNKYPILNIVEYFILRIPMFLWLNGIYRYIRQNSIFKDDYSIGFYLSVYFCVYGLCYFTFLREDLILDTIKRMINGWLIKIPH